MRFWYPYHIVEHKGFDKPVQIDLPDSVFATCMYTQNLDAGENSDQTLDL